ncbi:MAG: hypothetical protein NT080_00635 [Spirochaetes bacterium]|nr:hypothetical protein [Spirochaetota bacterium]
MAVTYEEIKKYLGEEGIKYSWDEDRSIILTGSATANYAKGDGGKALTLIVRLEEDGEYFKLMAPNLYSYKDGPNKLALMQTLLMVCWKTKLIEYEYDDSDGEVRCIIEFPLEDGTVTKRQFLRCFRGIVQLVDEYDAEIRTAMATGRPDLSDPKVPAPMNAMFSEFMRLLAEATRESGNAAAGADVGLEE